MAFEQLWNGWRSNYVQGAPRSFDPPRDGRSVFTAILESGEPDGETHIIHRGERGFAILNAFPYASGHLLVRPYRQEGDLRCIASLDTGGTWSNVCGAPPAFQRALDP